MDACMHAHAYTHGDTHACTHMWRVLLALVAHTCQMHTNTGLAVTTCYSSAAESGRRDPLPAQDKQDRTHETVAMWLSKEHSAQTATTAQDLVKDRLELQLEVAQEVAHDDALACKLESAVRARRFDERLWSVVPWLRPAWTSLCARSRRIIDHRAFSALIMFFIVLNTVILASVFFEQQDYEANYRSEFAEHCVLPPSDLAPADDVSLELLANHTYFWQLRTAIKLELERRGVSNDCSDLISGSKEVIGMPTTWHAIQRWINLSLTVVFVLEMLLKLLGLGFKRYVADAFNLFDGVVVVLSILEIIIETATGGGGGSSLAALRALRLFRVFKLARSWTSLLRILQSLQRSCVSLAPLCILLLLFIFMFSLLGMQLFGSIYPAEARSNFFSLLPSQYGYGAMLTVFQILTGENWNEVMYNGMSAAGADKFMYFFFLVCIGVYMIMNLFVAVLTEGFSELPEDSNDDAVTTLMLQTTDWGEFDSTQQEMLYEIFMTFAVRTDKHVNRTQLAVWLIDFVQVACPSAAPTHPPWAILHGVSYMAYLIEIHRTVALNPTANGHLTGLA